MTVLTDRAKAVLDNLKGSTFAGARAVEIAEDFINEKATVRQHNIHKAALANDAAETQAGDDSVTDL
jgi:hypothetical protein